MVSPARSGTKIESPIGYSKGTDSDFCKSVIFS
jgi:hypothetical protein